MELCSVYHDANPRNQLHGAALKKQADEKRRAERKQRHLQDDFRYALKKLPQPLDITLQYEEVCEYSFNFTLRINIYLQAIPLVEHLPEYKALEDEDGRRAAFARFVKRQKVYVIFALQSLFSYRTCRNGNEK